MPAPDNLSYGRDAQAAVIADGVAAERLAAVIRGAGGRALAPIAWSGAAGYLSGAALAPLLVLDTGGAPSELLEVTLPLVADLTVREDVRAVVRMDRGQIDDVVPPLLASGALLLCEPTATEEAAAIATLIVAGEQVALHVAENDEDGKLRELNEGVVRIAETLARIARGAGPRGGVAERPMTFAAAPALGEPASPVRARDIRDAIRARRLRDQFFDAGLFEDPAWDMLLDLYAAELERAQVSVSSLCIAANVAATTALRWIGKMTSAGLLERRPDPFDRRRAFMALSRKAAAGMDAYAVALRQAGLRFA